MILENVRRPALVFSHSCEKTRANIHLWQHAVCLLISATGYTAHENTHSLVSWGKKGLTKKEVLRGILCALHVNMPFCSTKRDN